MPTVRDEGRRDASVSTSASLPPQDLDAEQATLGSMLLDNSAATQALSVLSDDDFYRQAHQFIFGAIYRVAERGEPVDLVTVTAELRRMDQLEEVGGGEYLLALMQLVPTTAHVDLYADIVAQKALLRKLITAGAEIQAMAYENPDDVNSLLDRAEAKIFQLAERRVAGDFVQIGPVVTETFDRLDEAFRKSGSMMGIPTGLKDLDKFTQGLQRGDLVIVAGRPSMGKTSLAINNIGIHAAITAQVPIGIFSLEMSKLMLTESMLCSLAKVDSWKLRRSMGGDEEWSRIGQALSVLPNAPIYIDDTPGLPIMELRSKARRLKARADIGLLIVDYLQLIGGETRGSYENRHQEVSGVARALKGIARELDIPVVVLSQLSRRVEQRENKRPILSDLAESGSIEAEADVVAFLFRPAYYKQREAREQAAQRGEAPPAEAVDDIDTPDQAEIIIAKHRNGPVGTADVMFDKKCRVFLDIDPYG